ncbi:MAG: chemotaxis protein CheW [Methylococcales bacterium]|nr:chemotaxis protein CheW [Methylococcales bacterium]
MELKGKLADLSLVELLNKANVNEKNLRYGFQIGHLNLIYDGNIACELLKGSSIYSVPNTPKWMLGLINLRGNVVPAFDLENYFDFNPLDDKHQLLLVLGKGEKAVAFRIKQYPELLNDLTKEAIIPTLIPKIAPYILGAYKGEKIWLEFNKERFFSVLGKIICD